MGNLRVLFSLFILIPSAYAAADCFISECRQGSPSIRFPFQLDSQLQRNCGYPAFNLSCNNKGDTVLKLPHSGSFFVRGIDYLTQEIHIYDPENCLPRRLLSLNLSGSPFFAVYARNYTFLRCRYPLTNFQFTNIESVDCLSNSTNVILATPSIGLARAISDSCSIVVTLPVPVSWPAPYDDGFSSDLSDDLQLSWDVPDCRECETRGSICGFFSSTSQNIGCLSSPGTGVPSQPAQAKIFRIISLCITLPVIACAIMIASFIRLTNRAGDRNRPNATQQNGDAAGAPPEHAVATTGLDESTIASYTKLVLGESRRIPGPNHGVCAICLSEYEAQESVRCMPGCNHCFHADCIDEWLRKNISCPVCRVSPSHASSG